MNHALNVLEFDKVSSELASRAESEAGRELCLALRPSFEADTVWNRLTTTTEAYGLLANDPPPSVAIPGPASSYFDRASKGSTLRAEELASCGSVLRVSRSLAEFFDRKMETIPLLGAHREFLFQDVRLENRLVNSVTFGGDVLDSASPALAATRGQKNQAAARVLERLQEFISGRTREIMSDPVFTVRRGRYVLPVKAEYKGRVKGIVHDVSSTGATVFIEPEVIVALSNKVAELEAAERAEIEKVLKALSSEVGAHGRAAILAIESLAQIDLTFAAARLAYDWKATPPLKKSMTGISLEKARHPLIDPEKVVPIDVEVTQTASLLITGPNTGGKTVALKTVGLSVAMLHCGLFAPALHVEFGCFTGLWADIGDEQSLEQSLSTFSGHMKNVAEALKKVHAGSLVLFDELGAGTDPTEGAALAIAILDELAAAKAVVMASTHFGELKAYAFESGIYRNAAMEFNEKTLKPTYKLLIGVAGASKALKIAAKYGIPPQILERAESLTQSHDRDIGQAMAKLDEAVKLNRRAQGDADKKAVEVEVLRKSLAIELEKTEEIRKNLRSRIAAEFEETLRTIRVEAADTIDKLKSARTPEAFAAAQREISALSQKSQDFLQKKGLSRVEPVPALIDPTTLTVGAWVQVPGFPQPGRIVEILNAKTALVQIGAVKVSSLIDKLRPAEPTKLETNLRKTSSKIALAKAMTVATEIHLRRMRVDEAEEKLNKFLDDAVLAGLDSVRIVHGKGEGVLRALTHGILRTHSHVAKYRDAESGEGGHGATVAHLK